MTPDQKRRIHELLRRIQTSGSYESLTLAKELESMMAAHSEKTPVRATESEPVDEVSAAR